MAAPNRAPTYVARTQPDSSARRTPPHPVEPGLSQPQRTPLMENNFTLFAGFAFPWGRGIPMTLRFRHQDPRTVTRTPARGVGPGPARPFVIVRTAPPTYTDLLLGQ